MFMFQPACGRLTIYFHVILARYAGTGNVHHSYCLGALTLRQKGSHTTIERFFIREALSVTAQIIVSAMRSNVTIT